MSDSKEYYVGISIHNCFYVEAANAEEARAIVEKYDAHSYLDECELIINFVEETPS